jgi:hypothetical protein
MNKKDFNLLAEANTNRFNQPQLIADADAAFEIDDLAETQMIALRLTTKLLLADHAKEITLSDADRKQLILVYRELQGLVNE